MFEYPKDNMCYVFGKHKKIRVVDLKITVYIRERILRGCSMKLDEYLFRTKTTKTDFAEKVGISRGYLQHLLSGIKSP
jgi:hypothetical protein